ncbi:hypothetical protein D0Z07_5650 [Hyphodiscus hymeniophilus]|uniref:Protein-S-isoprenylcysteine O-methyltransferase n=1 Tax=Hyphodiscus hymeniophilus TaxID=353542 RepID=A0A9P6VHL6_9HELO|nr:hypothetical protein D0Z07_5650 [Hyphodiscus hymeniophilus]
MSILNTTVSLGVVASLSLAIAVFIASYITALCFTPSNRDPQASKQAGYKSSSTKFFFFYYANTTAQLMGLYHAILCLNYPTPSSKLCPRPSNISPLLFTWNPHTVLCLALIVFAGQVLLSCFTRLGPNFSQDLTPPRSLVTTGPYRWIQHPSYAASIIIFLTNCALFQRRDGVAACWLPTSVIHGETFGHMMWVGYLGTAAVGCYALIQRVKSEEAVLRSSFGAEWDIYHKRTKRFIPGLV